MTVVTYHLILYSRTLLCMIVQAYDSPYAFLDSLQSLNNGTQDE